MTIETKETDEKKWGLYVNGVLIGDSKNRFDADHAVVMLRKALCAWETSCEYVDL